jgi:hypothetical protein
MVNRLAGLILPLVHHLVNERLDRLAPSVTPNVSSADRDLPSLAGRIAMSVMPEPALHPSRYAYRNPCERAAESLAIQLFVRATELLGHRVIIAMSSLGRPRLARRRLELESELRLVVDVRYSASSAPDAEEEL